MMINLKIIQLNSNNKMLVYNIKQMAKKNNYKNWIIIALILVVILFNFFPFQTFSSMNLFEGFNNKPDPCSQYSNCTQCSNANVGGSDPNQYGGICGWCKKTGSCMSTEQDYYMNNQDFFLVKLLFFVFFYIIISFFIFLFTRLYYLFTLKISGLNF